MIPPGSLVQSHDEVCFLVSSQEGPRPRARRSAPGHRLSQAAPFRRSPLTPPPRPRPSLTPERPGRPPHTKPPKRTTLPRPRASTTLRRPASTTTTSSTVLHATSGDSKAIAKELKPSVVGITATRAVTASTIYYKLGTGVIYSATATTAYIVTCNHVIERDDGTAAKRIRVTLPSGSTVTATLVGRDPSTDIAVLRVKARKLTPAVFRTDLSELARRTSSWPSATSKS